MKGKLKFYRVNPDYCEYLLKYDNNIPYNSKEKEDRPFVGVLFKVGRFSYFAPLTSPKEKHKTMNNQIDFTKIANGRYGAINFNNMIPVNKEDLIYFNFNNEDNRYVYYHQYKWVLSHQNKLREKALNLYNFINSDKAYPNLIERCCNFSLLEQKCQEWQQIQQEEYKKGLELYYKHHPNEYSDELEDDFDDQDYDDEPSMKM